MKKYCRLRWAIRAVAAPSNLIRFKCDNPSPEGLESSRTSNGLNRMLSGIPWDPDKSRVATGNPHAGGRIHTTITYRVRKQNNKEIGRASCRERVEIRR